MRVAAILIGLAIAACALLTSHQRKPFPLLIDEPNAKPAAWPAQVMNHQVTVMKCQPMVITIGPKSRLPITRT